MRGNSYSGALSGKGRRSECAGATESLADPCPPSVSNREVRPMSFLTRPPHEENCCYSNWSVIFCGQENSRQELGPLEGVQQAGVSGFVLTCVTRPRPPTLPQPTPHRLSTGPELVPSHCSIQVQK